MALEIPAYNLFMMCESLQREAFAPLPAGYSVRLCREDELETWMALTPKARSRSPSCKTITSGSTKTRGSCFLRSASLSATARTPRWAPAFCGSLRQNHHPPLAEGAAPAGSLGLGRGLLSQVLAQAGPEDFPIYLHTHPSCFRAVHLYGEFGFRLLRGPAVGGRSNDLEKSLPYLEQAMPREYFQQLAFADAPQALLQAAAGLPEEF